MTMGVKHLKNKKGQAAIETALALPFLIFLLYWTLNAFHSIHTSHVAQKYAAMNMYQRLDNRAQFVVDGVEDRQIDKGFLAVQFTDDQGNLPQRRILLGRGFNVQVNSIVGVCREPGCN